MAKSGRSGEGALEPGLDQDGAEAEGNLGYKGRPAQGGREGHNRPMEDEAEGRGHHGGSQGDIV